MKVSAAEAREVFGLSIRDIMHASKGIPCVTPCGSYVLTFIPGATIQGGEAFTVEDRNNDHA